MARFYASMKGNRGEATRMGTATSGLEAHIRGWGIGIRVECQSIDGGLTDVIRVYKTGGSNDPKSEKLLCAIDGVAAQKKADQ